VLDLNEVTAGVERMLRRLIDSPVEFRTEIAVVPLPIFGDEAQIEQVLMNLIINARDAMASGGR